MALLATLLLALLALLAVACAGGDVQRDEATTSATGPMAGAPTSRPATDTLPDSTTTAAEPTTTTTVPGPPRDFTVAATGDFLLHMPVHASAANHAGGNGYDFGPMLAEVASEIAGADFAICHMETPLSVDNTDLSGFPMFNASRDIAHAAAEAGFDACSTASNHSLDRGMDGVVQTLDVLDQAGLGHAGTARNADEAEAVALYDVEVRAGGEIATVSVGHLAYTYGLNGLPLPEGAPWAVDLIDVDIILADASRARDDGAEVVIVSMHSGDEYRTEPSQEQVELARVVLGSPDVDAIVGAHAHVVQPVDRIGDGVVAYGLGNFLSNQVQRERTLDGVIVYLHFEEDPDGTFSVGDVSYTPTRVDPAGHVIRPVSPESDPASFDRTRSAIELLGFAGARVTTAP